MALVLAALCLLGVLAFRFPQYLTTPQLRQFGGNAKGINPEDPQAEQKLQAALEREELEASNVFEKCTRGSPDKRKKPDQKLAERELALRRPRGAQVGSGALHESGLSLRDSTVFSPPHRKHQTKKLTRGSAAASPKKHRVDSPPKMTLFTVE